MRTSRLTAPTALMAVGIIMAGCAPVGEGDMSTPSRSPGRQCFSIQQIDNFRQGNPDQVYLRVGRNDVYELNAPGGCRDVDFALSIALIPEGGMAGSFLCGGDWARVVVPGSVSRTSVCRVRISQRLTDEEVAALPASHRP